MLESADSSVITIVGVCFSQKKAGQSDESPVSCPVTSPVLCCRFCGRGQE